MQNPNIDKKSINDKYSILDVRAKANDNTIVDIEIQIANNSDMVKRTVYYLSKLIEEQIFEGDDYTKLIKSVTLPIAKTPFLSRFFAIGYLSCNFIACGDSEIKYS